MIGERHRWHAVRGHLHELDGDLPAAASAYARPPAGTKSAYLGALAFRSRYGYG